MYLEKLEIQGFKSFANKNILVFPGMLDKTKRGLTAIVGPNGSGKSNTADAVRWALGEQSMKTLRGKKSEDIIFSGSDKKGKLGMAEVSLYLNNDDRKAPIDYSQVVLTRRLYRNGDSEYFINNSRVRLYDVLMLLAKANFGQKTYSVIGQGMVEGFLNTSLSERKEFFDEATGVKQFQIKRDESLNKLVGSYDNLNQAQMLLSEIEPRLKSLTRQVGRLQKRGEIEAELKELQLNYYGRMRREISDKFNAYNKSFLEAEKFKLEKEKKLELLNRELNKMEAQEKFAPEFSQWQKELAEGQACKDALTKQLARLEAQKEIKLESSGQFDLSWLNNKKSELQNELSLKQDEIAGIAGKTEPEKNRLNDLQIEKAKIDNKIYGFKKQLADAAKAAQSQESAAVGNDLKLILDDLKQAETESDLDKVKAAIIKIRKKVERFLNISQEDEEKQNISAIQNEIIKLTQEKEEAAVKTNERSLKISLFDERLKLLNQDKNKLRGELESIEDKLKHYGGKSISAEESDVSQNELKLKLEQAEQKIRELKEKISSYARLEEEKRNRLFTFQRDIQNLQNETNRLNSALNEIKVNSARYEIKLESLEAEVRQNFGSMKEIKEFKGEGEIDCGVALEKINQLKRHLDAIGSIDPEIEKEYIDTKERFDFLSGQVDDLMKAIESLKEIIKELDVTIKERFDKEFKLISAKFEEYFKILFNGGHAKIIKVMENEKENEKTAGTDDEKQAESKQLADLKKIKFLQKHNATGLAGIEIQATPPGKKIKSVSMLSGGERALTAIALISAIISANPSPFVVLDEVDAALDEANSERLAKILGDLSHKTQFIVITHNRASMRRACILYGVTMGDDGVSKLLSIKLDNVNTSSS